MLFGLAMFATVHDISGSVTVNPPASLTFIGLLQSPILIDIVLTLMVLEAGILMFFFGRKNTAFRLASVLPNLLAGGSLVLAVKVALSEHTWPWLPVCLTASLAFHLLDLRARSIIAR